MKSTFDGEYAFPDEQTEAQRGSYGTVVSGCQPGLAASQGSLNPTRGISATTHLLLVVEGYKTLPCSCPCVKESHQSPSLAGWRRPLQKWPLRRPLRGTPLQCPFMSKGGPLYSTLKTSIRRGGASPWQVPPSRGPGWVTMATNNCTSSFQKVKIACKQRLF